MKHLLITTIAAVLLAGCGESQQSTKPEPTGVKAPDNLIRKAVRDGNIEAVKQYLAAGTDVNAKDESGETPLDWAIMNKQTELTDLLRKHGGKTAKELKAATN